MSFVVLGMKAITVNEAYEQIITIPGATLTDVPKEDCVKEGMDWGKVIIFMQANNTTIAQVEKVLAEITEPEVLNINAQDSKQILGYASKQNNGRTRALIYVSMPDYRVVVFYAQGDDDIISDIKID